MKGAETMFLFQTRSFWKIMNIPHAVISKKYKEYFGEDKEITDRKEAISILRGITENIQNKMVFRIKNEDTYAMLFKLHYIFDEVHSKVFKCTFRMFVHHPHNFCTVHSGTTTESDDNVRTKCFQLL